MERFRDGKFLWSGLAVGADKAFPIPIADGQTSPLISTGPAVSKRDSLGPRKRHVRKSFIYPKRWDRDAHFLDYEQ